MNPDFQEKLLRFTLQTAREAGTILMSHYGNLQKIKQKSSAIDLVTAADVDSEKYIVNEIQSCYPAHDILTEETPVESQNSDFLWVIDPLDGTTNFVHQLPIFAVSIGLQYLGKTIVGVVFNPAVDKLFHASSGFGSFLNNKPIHSSSTITLSDSLLVTGFPYTHDNYWNHGFTLFKDIYSKTRGVRRLGAAALDFCFTAMGRFDGYWEFGLQPWDICAGALILQEAGGKVTDWDGSEFPFSGDRILATNGEIHRELEAVLSRKKT
ncbi:MAG: inositol monophosphatase family protein [Candidatus Marinimicrobia bacterium]|jgi:myo-inositol-1(or 4)-monophosphatase|nr:inositol monophosphatase family protein [Candidatus Neomarinimicrobiota bacterium]MDP6852531.1 inositol monophosphatase family protein [Candidatus Neomarinimicrobiota bacterium]MDP6936149.1 inositol monophosphatase family protein [Candidatus Neomarinimicrobiota bacterium]